MGRLATVLRSFLQITELFLFYKKGLHFLLLVTVTSACYTICPAIVRATYLFLMIGFAHQSSSKRHHTALGICAGPQKLPSSKLSDTHFFGGDVFANSESGASCCCAQRVMFGLRSSSCLLREHTSVAPNQRCNDINMKERRSRLQQNFREPSFHNLGHDASRERKPMLFAFAD